VERLIRIAGFEPMAVDHHPHGRRWGGHHGGRIQVFIEIEAVLNPPRPANP
jgi:hypothetical protein